MYTDIFDNIDISRLSIEESKSKFENIANNVKLNKMLYTALDNCTTANLSNSIMLINEYKDYSGDEFIEESFLNDKDNRRNYIKVLDNIGHIAYYLDFIDTPKMFDEDGFYYYALWHMNYKTFRGLTQKISDIATHLLSTDSENSDIEWFFIYRAVYMICEFFKLNYF